MQVYFASSRLFWLYSLAVLKLLLCVWFAVFCNPKHAIETQYMLQSCLLLLIDTYFLHNFAS